MFFFPYRIDLELKSLPLITILICILCGLVYKKQFSQDNQHNSKVNEFCYNILNKEDIKFLRNISHEETGNQCEIIFKSIRESVDSNLKINTLVKESTPLGYFPTKADEFNYVLNRLDLMYQRYVSRVPDHLTDKLAYDPKDLDLLKMITSTFTHGSLYHLIGNLIFFYVFAASVEIVVGSFVYLGFISITAIGTSLAYSYSVRGVVEALPTIGLSGVVMAMVAALAVMMPYARIRCFFWIIIYFKVFRIPALFIATWFIGWDLYNMTHSGVSQNVDYVAHVSGAVMGALLGLFYILFKRDSLRNLKDAV